MGWTKEERRRVCVEVGRRWGGGHIQGSLPTLGEGSRDKAKKKERDEWSRKWNEGRQWVKRRGWR